MAASVLDIWSARTSAADNNWQDVAWSESLGLFVAVSNTGTNRVMTSPDGETWTLRASADDSQTWVEIAWAPSLGLFAAVAHGAGTQKVMTSPDGITWTLRTTPTGGYNCLVWAEELGYFVALSNAEVSTSPDGIVWTAYSLPETRTWSGIAWAPELPMFVTVCPTAPVVGQHRVMSSPDGVTWTVRTEAIECLKVAWSPELRLFAAVAQGAGSQLVQTSPDGTTWTLRTTPSGPNSWYNVAWSPALRRFVAIDYQPSTTSAIMSSGDGLTWTLHEAPTTNELHGIAWSPALGKFVVVGTSGTGDRVLTSQSIGNRADWLAWPIRSITAAVVLQPNLVLSGWTAVGMSAPDVYVTSLPRLVLTDVVAGGLYQRCVGVNENGTALTERASIALVSTHASSWYWDEANGLLYAHSSTGSDPDLFAVFFAQVQFHVSNDGRVLNLIDGVSSTGVPFRPWLPGQLPSVSREVEDFFFGQKISATTALSILNDSFAFYRLLASDSSYWWKNTPVRIYLGGDYNGRTLAWSQYLEYLTMLVEDAACDDVSASFQLKPLARLLSIDIPPRPYFESDYAHLGDGVRGRRVPIGYGRAVRRPDLTDTTVSYGRWTIADATYQTLFAVHSVVAISKTDGSRTTLTLTTHYTVNLTACTVTIVHASYGYTTHEIEVDVTGKPDGSGSYLKSVGQIARDLLETFLNPGAASIDTAAFTQADADASAELSIWLPDSLDSGARTLGSIFSSNSPDMASIEGSVFASLKQNRAGQWTIKVWSPGYDASTVVTLNDEDFVSFAPEPKLETIYPEARVYYARNHSTGDWSVASATDAAVAYLSKSTDVLERRTYLRNASDATTQAQRALFMSGAQPQEVEFVLRTAKLAEALEGDKVIVNRTRALSAAGTWETKLCELLRIDLSPTLEIGGRLTDDRGIGAKVGHWKDSAGSDFSSATDEEKTLGGFWADSNSEIVPGDPKTRYRSVWW